MTGVVFAMEKPDVSLPLCVDLDGTLIVTDMLHESSLRLLRDHPWRVLALPWWLARGKAHLKRELAQRVDLQADALPYNLPFLGWLKTQREQGRRMVLCTASDEKFAQAIAAHVGLFDETLASDGARNLAGQHKADLLCERFGERGFDYAGNSSTDLAVWGRARRAVVVNASAALARAAQAKCEVEQIMPAAPTGLLTWGKALRVHQWLKNALLFVPMLAAHQVGNLVGWQNLLLAFLAFGVSASAVYLANDLVDLESDRLHPRKCRRPFASGALPLWQGVLAAPLCAAAGLALGALVGKAFLGWLCFYLLITTAYSLWFKRRVLVDCLALAALYTLRIIAGAAAIGISLSFWLLAVSVFLFLSLAFVKRYAELIVQAGEGRAVAHGRGYRIEDAPLLQSFGIASGFAAAMVLALYLNSDAVLRLYVTPQWVWGTVPVLLFWVCWVWLRAHRGEMHDDPMVFAVKDGASLLAGLAFVAMLAMGSI